MLSPGAACSLGLPLDWVIVCCVFLHIGSVGRILIVSLKAVAVLVGGVAADAAGACLSSMEGWP